MIDPAAKQEALAIFGPEGALSRVMERFEFRPQQADMAALIWEAMSAGKAALIEAGTGTGKSLAYLYPGLVHARANGRPLIVSTNTINLQEQLLAKDLPLLAALAGAPPPKTALLMGRANYICRRRLEAARLRGTGAIPSERWSVLLAADAGGAGQGGRLPEALPDEIRREVCSHGDLCLRQRCPWASSCHWQAARKAAGEAEILLVNHHLLLADVALRRALGWETERAVLPSYDLVVLDEAHHLEDIAGAYFSTVLNNLALARALDWLAHALPVCRLGLTASGAAAAERRPEIADLAARSMAHLETARGRAGEFFAGVAALARRGKTGEGGLRQWRYREDLLAAYPDLAARAENLGLVLTALGDLLARLIEAWEAPGAETPQTEEGLLLRAARAEMLGVAANLQPVLAGEGRDHVYWLSAGGGRGGEEIEAVMAPLSVGPLIHQSLLSNLHSAVLVSATLATGEGFSFIRERLGLDLVHASGRLEAVFDSPFDYRRQVLLAAPLDLPGPDEAGFPGAAAAFLAGLLAVTNGRTLVLFNSFAALRDTGGALQPRLPAGLRLLRQGERPRAALLEEFMRDDGAVLLGTDSFWEGVDVPGLALSCVVLARLPFRVPTEPLAQARMERLEEDGLSSFYHYALPQAQIKFKQGFGRLIRRRDDRGVVVILDRRVRERAYGREFLAALPECAECFRSSAEVLAAVGEWLGKKASREP